MDGTTIPDGSGKKKYRAGHFRCDRFDIDEQSGESVIVTMKDLVVKQEGATVVFDTVKDAASYLTRPGGSSKDKYYGKLLLETERTL